MENNKDQQQEDTPFNMAMMFYFRLNKLLEVKDQAMIQSNLEVAFKTLKAIYRNICFKVSKEDKKLLDEKFKKAADYLKTPLSNNSVVDQQMRGLVDMNVGEILDDIDRDIMNLMDKKNMIFPNVNLKYGMDKITERYSLNG